MTTPTQVSGEIKQMDTIETGVALPLRSGTKLPFINNISKFNKN